MLTKPFYNASFRKCVIAFGSLFDELSIERVDESGTTIDTIPIPLSYIPKEKFIKRILETTKFGDQLTIETTLPRMGFEMGTPSYAGERKSNTMETLISPTGEKLMFNRSPWDVPFQLFIATRKIDDSFRIVEQILPYFTPELNVRILDNDDFNIVSNIPIVLQAVDMQIDAIDSFDDKRTMLWTLTFLARTWIYAPIRGIGLIKRTEVDVRDYETKNFYEEYVARVLPMTAGIDDPHVIEETINSIDSDGSILNIHTGTELEATLD